MPLPVPPLDDRRFDDLVADLLARIPAHTPEWTNPRVGDPGRTLIELFAFLGDSLLFRANQVPERQRRVFLNLLGLGRRPARAARGIVALLPAPESRDAIDLQLGARISRPQPFEALQEVSVAPVSGEVYVKRRVDSNSHPELTETIAQLGQLYGGQRLDTYETTPLFADGLAVPEGVDVVGDTVDGALWLALLAPTAGRSEVQSAVNQRSRELLARHAADAPRLINVGVVPARTVADDQRVPPASRISSQWEISVDGGDRTDYQTLDAVADSTEGLKRAGVLRLVPPGANLIGVGPSARGLDARSGVDDEPPRLDDPTRQARLIAWLRLRPAAGVTQLRLAWAGLHAVQIVQGTRRSAMVVAETQGLVGERISLPLTDIDPSTLQLQIAEPGEVYQDWTAVDDLAVLPHSPAAARNARAYELDPQSGEIRLGDGVRGRLPAAGSRIKIAQARSGGGRAGNLGAGTLRELQGQAVGDGAPLTCKLLQPLPTEGGEDAESVEAAEARTPGHLRHHERAITGDDYATLARQTPGVEVGRVELLPRFVPRTRASEVPGVVSVMVLPGHATGEVGSAPNPRPDTPFIEAVHAQLDARRPLATELYVMGCEYVPMSLSVAVGLRDDAPHDATLAAVRAALRRLLWPLAPGGLDGQGWALGRSVADRELEVEAARVPGVASVAGVNVFERVDGQWRALPRSSVGTQLLTLARWQLPELMQLTVVAGNSVPERLDGSDPMRDDDGVTRVAVPVITDLC
ncbi:MAG: hypothetical protein RJA98_527 [Pseudomonadota bacterium]